MTESQYDIVKYFLNQMSVHPKILVKKWNAIWQKQGKAIRLELVEVYRVFLTANYELYKKDGMPDEDVLLAMDGLL